MTASPATREKTGPAPPLTEHLPEDLRNDTDRQLFRYSLGVIPVWALKNL